ncbi:MAG: Holliday junction resolvase RuvX [Anaerolineaceae bacterium]
MKYLGVDPGNVRIGLSVSDEQGLLARPLTIFKHISRLENARRIAQTAALENCATIVVGVPYDSEGGIGPRARASLKLIETLRSQTEAIVLPWDESGTSQTAGELLFHTSVSQKKRRLPKDDLAAAIILQDFLENQQKDHVLEKVE